MSLLLPVCGPPPFFFFSHFLLYHISGFAWFWETAGWTFDLLHFLTFVSVGAGPGWAGLHTRATSSIDTGVFLHFDFFFSPFFTFMGAHHHKKVASSEGS